MTTFNDALRSKIIENALVSGVQPLKRNLLVDEILKSVLEKPSFQAVANVDYTKTYTEGSVGKPDYTRYDRTQTGFTSENDWENHITSDEIKQLVDKFRE